MWSSKISLKSVNSIFIFWLTVYIISKPAVYNIGPTPLKLVNWFQMCRKKGCPNNKGRQLFALGHHLVGALVLCDMRWTLHTRLRSKRNAPHNSAVACQRGYHSNNKPSCYLVGTLTSHWQPLTETPELSALFGYILKPAFASSDSFCLITSHVNKFILWLVIPSPPPPPGRSPGKLWGFTYFECLRRALLGFY